MASTSISLSEVSNKAAVLTCKGAIVTVEFVDGITPIGTRHNFSRAEAKEFDERVSKTGQWQDFPFTGIDSGTVKALGARLKDFAVNGR